MTAIRAENLSKIYTLGSARHGSIRDLLSSAFQKRSATKTLKALDDVSFSAQPGETLGIIGRNGAGKSTLLKILSRITRPSGGRAEICGRVGSLLEVGTGFHNELSGRENIYLNGTILGMGRAEITRKFDEIVTFSEIEKFLDTPVKHYSSGMYMRLAFSVAAHLEPEVLIVDEVLAVGDVGFQRKCLDKMRDVSRAGRTVLFVSHDTQAVTRLCSRAIWLSNGRLALDGDAGEVVSAYLHEEVKTSSERSWPDDERPGNEVARLMTARVHDGSGQTVSSIDIRKPVTIEMTYEVAGTGKVVVPNIHFFNDQNVCLFVSHDWKSNWRSEPRAAGIYTSRVRIPGNFLAEGSIFVGVALTTYEPLEVHFVEWDALTFNIVDSLDGDTARGDFAGPMPGLIRPVLEWETEAGL